MTSCASHAVFGDSCTPPGIVLWREVPRAVGGASHSLNRLLDAASRLAPRLVRELAGRPLALAATAVEEPRHSASAPGWLGLRRWPPGRAGGGMGLSIEDEEGLLHVWRAGVLELRTRHAPWPREAAHPGVLPMPDRLVFGLDRDADTPWLMLLEVADLLRASLETCGLVSLLKTSGRRGLHLVVPVAAGWPAAALVGIAEAAVSRWSHHHPHCIAPQAGHPAGRVRIDPRCNASGASLVAAYSLCACETLGVSMPVRWSELDRITAGDHWTLANLPARLVELGDGDPWAGQGRLAQPLDRLVRSLGLPVARP